MSLKSGIVRSDAVCKNKTSVSHALATGWDFAFFFDFAFGVRVPKPETGAWLPPPSAFEADLDICAAMRHGHLDAAPVGRVGVLAGHLLRGQNGPRTEHVLWHRFHTKRLARQGKGPNGFDTLQPTKTLLRSLKLQRAHFWRGWTGKSKKLSTFGVHFD